MLRPFRFLPLLAAASLLAADPPPAAVDPAPVDLAGYFRPFQTDRAALAPSGRHMAYPRRQGDRLFLVILDLEQKTEQQLPLANDEVEAMSGAKQPTPLRLTFLEWVSDTRLVACLQDDVVFGVDADGRNFKQLTHTRDLKMSATKPPLPPVPPRGSAGVGHGAPDTVLPPAPPPLPVPKWVLESEPEAPADADTPVEAQPPLETSATADVFAEGAIATNEVSPHVLGLLPDDPDHILVEARPPTGPTDDSGGEAVPFALISELFKLNVRTGKLTTLGSERTASRLLADQQGRLRLALTHFGTERDFKVFREAGGRLQSLGKLSPEAAALRFGLTPSNFLEERSFPLGFGFDPKLLYFASNVGRDTYGVFSLDLATGKRTGLAVTEPSFDLADPNDPLPENLLVHDRYRHELAGVRFAGIAPQTRWLDPELRQLQQALEQKYPNATLEIIGWDRARTRFLIAGANQSDPGAFYLYRKETGRLAEFARRAPWIAPAQMHETLPFVVNTATGTAVSGYLTVPRTPRIKPMPLLVYCHDGPWSRDEPDYNRGVQALAAMGFAVVQVNYRGSAGFGQKHLDALRGGFDRPALDDILAVMDWLQGQQKVVSTRAVAIMGSGYGGYLALRALQLHPDRFRCGVSINAPTDLPAWLAHPPTIPSFQRDVRRAFFGEDSAALAAISPLPNAAKLTKPLLIVYSQRDDTVRPSHSLALHRALGGGKGLASLLAIPDEGHAGWRPGSWVRLFSQLEEFFNVNIYAYSVKLGELEVQDPPVPAR
jgi:pimeloyl-ACP methyl ester carboxylesterase